MRKFIDEVVTPDAILREEDGKPPSKTVIEAMAKVNLHAMRMGPGKHLEGLYSCASNVQFFIELLRARVNGRNCKTRGG